MPPSYTLITRKGSKVPYISHLLGVASILLEYGADEDEAIPALLHDAIEDQGGQTVRAEIRLKFGERVTEIVDGCTDRVDEILRGIESVVSKESPLSKAFSFLAICSPQVFSLTRTDTDTTPKPPWKECKKAYTKAVISRPN